MRKEVSGLQEKLSELEISYQKSLETKNDLGKIVQELRNHKSDNETKLDIMSQQLSEKTHLEVLFLEVKKEMSENRKRFNQEREKLGEDLLDKEAKIREIKGIARDIESDKEKQCEDYRKLERELSRVKLLLEEGLNRAKREKSKKEIIRAENVAQKDKLMVYQQEVS